MRKVQVAATDLRVVPIEKNFGCLYFATGARQMEFARRARAAAEVVVVISPHRAC